MDRVSTHMRRSDQKVQLVHVVDRVLALALALVLVVVLP